MFLELPDLRNGYVDLGREILRRGELAGPRGLLTREVLDATVVVHDVHDLLPVGTGRKVNTGLAALEALQLIGGYSDPVQLKRCSALMGQFEDLGQFHGAYGPRVRPQLQLAVNRLREDLESRRAVIAVWDPLRDLAVHGVKNYPCTTQLQFTCRGGRLHLHVTMRANDFWHGLGYDAFVFGQLQCTVANALGVETGTYRHHANSLHIYEEHWEAAEALSHTEAPGVAVPDGFDPVGAAVDASGPVEDACERARQVGYGLLPRLPTDSELWYHEKTLKYTSPAPAGAQA